MACPPDSRKLSEINPYILPYCMALPEEMAMDYGRRAYIEFARRSGALKKTIVLDLQEGVLDYPIDLPEHYKVNRINWVDIAGCRVVIPEYDHDGYRCQWGGRSNQTLWRNYSGGATNGSYGYGPNHWFPCGATQFRMEGYDCIWLQQAPLNDHEGGLVIELAVQPTQDICYFDDDFFDRWVEGITYGALAKAMMVPNTDWYNPQSATYYDQKFRIEIARAKQKINLNNSRGPMRMQARRFV